MLRIKQYWEKVRSMERDLPDAPYMVSIEDRSAGRAGGTMAQVTRAIAARLIVDGAFRPATDKEIASHLATEEKRRADAHIAELAKQGKTIVTIAPTKKGKK